MAVEYDAVVVGMGLSGSCLVGELAGGAWAGRVLMVDGGRGEGHDRAWAFWARSPGWLGVGVEGSWRTIRVDAMATSRHLSLEPYRYFRLDGDGLRRALARRLDGAAQFEYRRGVVNEVREDGNCATLDMDGCEVSARWVFDSRPVDPTPGDARMVFLGWEVEAVDDVFDPGVVTFMDFTGRPPGRALFTHVVPHTSRHALVEVAEYRWDDVTPDLSPVLLGFLSRTCGAVPWARGRVEAGALPLVVRSHGAGTGRTVALGVRGGRLKASTGYALERIRRHSVELSASLSQHDHPHGVSAGHRRHAWLDAVFLDALRRDPDLIEVLMARLFRGSAAPDVLRFLDEDTSLAQEGRLVASLPAIPLVRAAAARLRSH